MIQKKDIDKAIAKKLGVSVFTVRSIRLGKLQVKTGRAKKGKKILEELERAKSIMDYATKMIGQNNFHHDVKKYNNKK